MTTFHTRSRPSRLLASYYRRQLCLFLRMSAGLGIVPRTAAASLIGRLSRPDQSASRVHRA